MPREKTFVMLLATFVVGGVLMGYFRNQSEFVQHKLSQDGPQPRPQSVKQRQWKEVRFEALPVQNVSEEPLLALMGGKKDSYGNVFVLDWTDSAIKKFSSEGEHLRSYRWALPEDVSVPPVPVDFAVSNAGEIWSVYTDLQLVKVLDSGGETKAILELEAPPHRIALGSEGDFVVMALEQSPHLFRSYGPNGVLRRQFGRIIAGDFQDRTLLDGMMAADGEGSFVYAPLYVGLLASYTIEGELRFLVQTINSGSEPLPRIIARPKGWQKLEPGSPWKSLTVHVADGRIYVLSERESTGAKQRILDVYSNDDGTYLHSIRLPNGPRDVLVDGDLLYTVHAEEILRWRMIAEGSTALSETNSAGG